LKSRVNPPWLGSSAAMFDLAAMRRARRPLARYHAVHSLDSIAMANSPRELTPSFP
jgi:hypothetical protein